MKDGVYSKRRKFVLVYSRISNSWFILLPHRSCLLPIHEGATLMNLKSNVGISLLGFIHPQNWTIWQVSNMYCRQVTLPLITIVKATLSQLSLLLLVVRLGVGTWRQVLCGIQSKDFTSSLCYNYVIFVHMLW